MQINIFRGAVQPMYAVLRNGASQGVQTAPMCKILQHLNLNSLAVWNGCACHRGNGPCRCAELKGYNTRCAMKSNIDFTSSTQWQLYSLLRVNIKRLTGEVLHHIRVQFMLRWHRTWPTLTKPEQMTQPRRFHTKKRETTYFWQNLF